MRIFSLLLSLSFSFSFSQSVNKKPLVGIQYGFGWATNGQLAESNYIEKAWAPTGQVGLLILFPFKGESDRVLEFLKSDFSISMKGGYFRKNGDDIKVTTTSADLDILAPLVVKRTQNLMVTAELGIGASFMVSKKAVGTIVQKPEVELPNLRPAVIGEFTLYSKSLRFFSGIKVSYEFLEFPLLGTSLVFGFSKGKRE